jgi:hypothetical protein
VRHRSASEAQVFKEIARSLSRYRAAAIASCRNSPEAGAGTQAGRPSRRDTKPGSRSAILHSQEMRYSGANGEYLAESHFVLDKSNRVFDSGNEELLDSEGRKDSGDRHGNPLPLDARREDPHAPSADVRRNESSFMV